MILGDVENATLYSLLLVKKLCLHFYVNNFVNETPYK